MCKGCKKKCNQCRIQCTLCDYALCYKCVTIPNEMHYKHDEHPLSICYGEDTNDKYWCEVCEKQLDPTSWFYACNKCCITIHRKCMFGSSIYMKSSYTFRDDPNDIMECFRNNRSSTRPICSYCHNRCIGFIYYKFNEMSLCSFDCLTDARVEIWDELDEEGFL